MGDIDNSPIEGTINDPRKYYGMVVPELGRNQECVERPGGNDKGEVLNNVKEVHCYPHITAVSSVTREEFKASHEGNVESPMAGVLAEKQDPVVLETCDTNTDNSLKVFEEETKSIRRGTSGVDVSDVHKEASMDLQDTIIVTMVDVHEEEEEVQESATAVLGACDENNCTYSKGYVKRQAVYACVTCAPKGEDWISGGICLACSYHCHEGHELIELYTKRNFRCDCGNHKFSGSECNLEPGKDRENKLNKYNHNFRGLYCVCRRPYPDPEKEVDDRMLQCIVCEDWFHEGHLGKAVPMEDNFEVVCAACMKHLNYLAHYADDDCGMPEESEECALKGKKNLVDVGTSFFPEGWRRKLCRCKSCKEQYDRQGVNFLLDNEDTLSAYEECGRSTLETPHEQAMRALSVMDRVQQVECLRGYNEMKEGLKEYLKKFVENGKVVRAEDIREFFAGMEARKKRRLNVHVPYHCH